MKTISRFFVIASLTASMAMAQASAPALPDAAADKAQWVVVAKMLQDIKPAVAAGDLLSKTPPAIRIEQTLKGPDLTGLEIPFAAGATTYEKDKKYVLFLRKDGPGQPVFAVGEQVLEADAANLDKVRKALADLKASVEPQRVVWMQHNTGRMRAENARQTEFMVSAKGDFRCLVRNPITKAFFEERAGTLPGKELAALLQQLDAAGKGPGAEDAGYVSFEYVDGKGLQTKEFSMPGADPAKSLLATVARLVAANTQTVGCLGPASTSAPAAKGLTDKQIQAVIEAVAKAPLPAGRSIKLLDKPLVTPIASNNVHLGGSLAIESPFPGLQFVCVLLGHGMAAPAREYACVTDDGKVTYPFAVDKDFAPLLAAADWAPWKDDDYLKIAMLYVHLSTKASEDGWVLLRKPEDFKAIKFNMPKEGTPQAEKRVQDAEKVKAPEVIHTKAGTTVRLVEWHIIRGAMQSWTFEFKNDKTLAVTHEDLCRWGGGGYD